MSFMAALPEIVGMGATEATAATEAEGLSSAPMSRYQNFEMGMSEKDKTDKPKQDDIASQIYSGIRSATEPGGY
jgi:hypothetical protein